MLGHRQNDEAPRDRGAGELRERSGIVIEMLEHVECPDDVPLRLERQVRRVELEKLCLRHPLPYHVKSRERGFAAAETHVRKALVHALEHEAGAAPDLEQALRIRCIASDQPADEVVPRAEPEVLGLELREL
jgi:hypothetical protein